MTHSKRNDCQLYLNGHLKEMKVSETQLPTEGSRKQRPHAVNEMPCSNLAGLWLSESQLRKRGGRWNYQSLGEPAHLQHKGYFCFLCENMAEEGAEGPRSSGWQVTHTVEFQDGDHRSMHLSRSDSVPCPSMLHKDPRQWWGPERGLIMASLGLVALGLPPRD